MLSHQRQRGWYYYNVQKRKKVSKSDQLFELLKDHNIPRDKTYRLSTGVLLKL